MQVPFQVRTSGLIDRQRFHSSPGTKQDDVMLTVFLDGSGTYLTKSNQQRIQSDMVGLVPPNDPGVLMSVPQDPYFHFWCRFNGEYAKHLANEIIKDRGERFFPVSNAADIAECLRKMGRHMSATLPDRMGRREILLAEALVLLQHASTSDTPPVLNENSIIEYLREGIAEPTDLQEMADHYRVSKSTLCRAAKRCCSDTIQRLHERMKMDWAKILLATGTLNVTEVGLRVGYGDPFYFSRIFTKYADISPRNWMGSQYSS